MSTIIRPVLWASACKFYSQVRSLPRRTSCKYRTQYIDAIDNPLAAVLKVKANEWFGAAQEGASYASGDVVILRDRRRQMNKKAMMSKFVGFLLIGVYSQVLSAAEIIPERFRGTWVIDIEATSENIANAASLPAELKESWTEHGATLLQFDYVITEDTIENWIRTVSSRERRGGAPEIGSYLVELKEEGSDYTVFVMNKDPKHCPAEGCSPEHEKYFHLRLREDGSLELRESDARGWDRSDPLQRLFVTRKSNDPKNLGETAQSNAVATSCSDQECFEAAFAACTPASFQTPKMLGARARYEVIGPVEGGCQVSLVYESNPNPQWVGKALEMTVAPEAPFIESFQNGMNACMMHKPEAACEGTLMNLLDGG